MTKITESKLLAAIRLALSGMPDLVLWRLSSGLSYGRNGKQYRAGLVPGAADLIGIGPNGRFVAFEVKTSRGRLSAKQKMWINLVHRHGGFATVVRSVEDAFRAMCRLRLGQSE